MTPAYFSSYKDVGRSNSEQNKVRRESPARRMHHLPRERETRDRLTGKTGQFQRRQTNQNINLLNLQIDELSLGLDR